MAEKFPKKETQEGEKELTHEELKELAGKIKDLELNTEKKPELPEESGKELEQDLVRLQAEFENYRKRTSKELQERGALGKMEFANSILPFIDEFETALGHLQGESKKGMQMVLENGKKLLQAQGVREMKCENERYDPYKHEVILQQESEKPEGTIIAIARKGYFFKEKVLRHAQVIVSKKPETKTYDKNVENKLNRKNEEAKANGKIGGNETSEEKNISKKGGKNGN